MRARQLPAGNLIADNLRCIVVLLCSVPHFRVTCSIVNCHSTTGAEIIKLSLKKPALTSTTRKKATTSTPTKQPVTSIFAHTTAAPTTTVLELTATTPPKNADATTNNEGRTVTPTTAPESCFYQHIVNFSMDENRMDVFSCPTAPNCYDECKIICEGNSSCTAFVFYNDYDSGFECYLKGSTSNLEFVDRIDVETYIRVCPSRGQLCLKDAKAAVGGINVIQIAYNTTFMECDQDCTSRAECVGFAYGPRTDCELYRDITAAVPSASSDLYSSRNASGQQICQILSTASPFTPPKATNVEPSTTEPLRTVTPKEEKKNYSYKHTSNFRISGGDIQETTQSATRNPIKALYDNCPTIINGGGDKCFWSPTTCSCFCHFDSSNVTWSEAANNTCPNAAVLDLIHDKVDRSGYVHVGGRVGEETAGTNNSIAYGWAEHHDGRFELIGCFDYSINGISENRFDTGPMTSMTCPNNSDSYTEVCDYHPTTSTSFTTTTSTIEIASTTGELSVETMTSSSSTTTTTTTPTTPTSPTTPTTPSPSTSPTTPSTSTSPTTPTTPTPSPSTKSHVPGQSSNLEDQQSSTTTTPKSVQLIKPTSTWPTSTKTSSSTTVKKQLTTTKSTATSLTPTSTTQKSSTKTTTTSRLTSPASKHHSTPHQTSMISAKPETSTMTPSISMTSTSKMGKPEETTKRQSITSTPANMIFTTKVMDTSTNERSITTPQSAPATMNKSLTPRITATSLKEHPSSSTSEINSETFTAFTTKLTTETSITSEKTSPAGSASAEITTREIATTADGESRTLSALVPTEAIETISTTETGQPRTSTQNFSTTDKQTTSAQASTEISSITFKTSTTSIKTDSTFIAENTSTMKSTTNQPGNLTTSLTSNQTSTSHRPSKTNEIDVKTTTTTTTTAAATTTTTTTAAATTTTTTTTTAAATTTRTTTATTTTTTTTTTTPTTTTPSTTTATAATTTSTDPSSSSSSRRKTSHYSSTTLLYRSSTSTRPTTEKKVPAASTTSSEPPPKTTTLLSSSSSPNIPTTTSTANSSPSHSTTTSLTTSTTSSSTTTLSTSSSSSTTSSPLPTSSTTTTTTTTALSSSRKSTTLPSQKDTELTTSTEPTSTILLSTKRRREISTQKTTVELIGMTTDETTTKNIGEIQRTTITKDQSATVEEQSKTTLSSLELTKTTNPQSTEKPRTTLKIKSDKQTAIPMITSDKVTSTIQQNEATTVGLSSTTTAHEPEVITTKSTKSTRKSTEKSLTSDVMMTTTESTIARVKYALAQLFNVTVAGLPEGIPKLLQDGRFDEIPGLFDQEGLKQTMIDDVTMANFLKDYDDVPRELLDELKRWQSNLLPPEERKLLEDLVGETIPEDLFEALEAGEKTAFEEWLRNAKIRPTNEDWKTFGDDPTYGMLPDSLKKMMDDLEEEQMEEDELEALGRFTGIEIPDGLIESLDSGDIPAFAEWMKENNIRPGDEKWAEIEALTKEGLFPADIFDALQKWKEAQKLTPLSVKELAAFAGVADDGSIPQSVIDEIDRGNPGAFVDWLNRQHVHTSRRQYQRLTDGQVLFNLPTELVAAIDKWHVGSWLIGAVKELKKFAELDEIDPDVMSAVENGDYRAYTDWLEGQGIRPGTDNLLRLRKRFSKVDIPQEFMEHLETWWADFKFTFPPVTTTTSAPTTEWRPDPGSTTTPVYPLSPAEEVAVSIMQSLGCAALLTILAATLAAYFIIVRDPSIERFLHMNQELALLVAHLMVLTMRDRTSTHIPCKLASIGLQSAFLSVFTFMAFEAFQAYTISSSVIGRDSVFNRKQLAVMGWVLPMVYSGCSAALFQTYYTSHWSCWLNLGQEVRMMTFLPIGLLSGATIVMIEAGGMDADNRKQSDPNPDQRTAALANQKGLLFVLPANVGSWFVGLYAVYEADITLYGMVFALNLTLAITIFAFHTLGNPKIHTLLKTVLPCLG